MDLDVRTNNGQLPYTVKEESGGLFDGRNRLMHQAQIPKSEATAGRLPVPTGVDEPNLSADRTWIANRCCQFGRMFGIRALVKREVAASPFLAP